MVTHSSILAWRIPLTEEPMVHRVTHSQTLLNLLSTAHISVVQLILEQHRFETHGPTCGCFPVSMLEIFLEI